MTDMTQVIIKHNPFTVDTVFLIDGVELTDRTPLHSFTKLSMQLWVDHLFNDLTTMFNGQNTFNVTFIGVEPDFRDLEIAAESARDKCITVNLEWIEAASAECRQAEIEAMRKEVLAHPGYESLLKDDAASRAALLESANHDFDVYIVATMSSGKSSLINALLGRDMLPVGNEATTATITRIYDNEAGASDTFRGERYDASDELLQTSEDVDMVTMAAWNKDPETSRIELHGRIAAARAGCGARLVLTDTPGPNNSNDEEHGRTTMSYIQDKTRNPLILYVLNATQLGITDDSQLLKLVADTIADGGRQASDRFIFVLNKMDGLDTEKGDDVAGMLARTRKYLKEHGIHKPQIFPVSAYMSRLTRFPDEALSKKERVSKASDLEWFGSDASMDLGSYSPLRKSERSRLEAETPELERRTGVPALEAAIGAYIENYHLPNRLKRNHDAMCRVIEEAVNRHKGIEELERGNVKELAAQIERVNTRRKKGVDGAAIAKQLAEERLELPPEVEKELVKISAKVEGFLHEDMAKISGKVSPTAAKKKALEWGGIMSFRYMEVINNYENANKQGLKAIKSALQDRYSTMVSTVFDDVDTVQFPALGRIMRSAASLTFEPKVSNKHFKTRKVKTGTNEVSDSTWYNPFSWFSTKTVSVYSDEDYVDLSEFYKENAATAEAIFDNLVKEARAKIENQAKTLLDVFVEHVENEFEPRVDELLSEALARIEDRELHAKALDEATKVRQWSEALRARLQRTLDIERMSA